MNKDAKKFFEHQMDLLKSAEENLQDFERYQLNVVSLPASPLQHKLATEEPHLTSREFEIMHMTLTGFSIYDIALKIHLSPHGVKYRLSSVYDKFHSKNRLELMKRAASTGLQFITESGIKHNFHLNINMREQNELKDPK